MTKRTLATAVTVAVLLIAGAFALLRWGPWSSTAAPPDARLDEAGEYRVGVVPSPDPARTGENTLAVVVRDRDGRPVRDAAVEVMVSMEAMGAMPRMESRAVVKRIGPGFLRAKFGLAMLGDWDVVLRVSAPGRTPAQLSYRLSTSLRGLAFETGTPVPGATAGAPLAGAAPDTASFATLQLDEARRQALGIRTAVVTRRDLTLDVKAPGRVAYDESRRADVALRYAGWARDVHADFTGRRVRKNETLFTAYSPELVSTQQEYLEAIAGREDTMHAEMGRPHEDLAAAARRRLERWGVPASVMDDLDRTRRTVEAVPVPAPVGGVVVEKDVVAGSAFAAGQVLYRIAPDDPAWVIANVYQSDLPQMHDGQIATLGDPYGGTAPRRGAVAFVYPEVQADTRAGQVRIEVANEDGALKPGMFVDVSISVPLGRRLAVPESAVLPTGARNVVFVDLGGGRLEPRDVQLGARAGEWIEVRSGLAEGEHVVTSGNFLLAAESKLRSAAGKW